MPLVIKVNIDELDGSEIKATTRYGSIAVTKNLDSLNFSLY
jgi:hypothetical protein